MMQFITATVKNVYRRIIASAVTLFAGGYQYDVAETTDENKKHWERARDRSPKLANTPVARQKVRIRCRYEADNNCYLSGLVSTLATDIIGYTCPKLQVLTEDTELNTFIEEQWIAWSENDSVNLPSNLRVLDETRRVEGEGFLYLTTDYETERRTGYSLSISVISPSRVCDPAWQFKDANTYRNIIDEAGTVVGKRKVVNDDGVIVDALTGKPIEFKVTPVVDDYNIFDKIKGSQVTVSARYMLQWFCPRRPGQFRGICELSPALPLYAQLRRYGLATLSAAEIAAMFAGVISTKVPPGEEQPKIEPGFSIEIERGSLIALPEGSDPHQFDPKQPVQSYEMFVNMILREIGRTLDVPFGIVAGDSSKYNYSSAQLDYRGYEERLNYDKKQLNIRILNPLFAEWLLELSTVNSKVRKALEAGQIYHSWHYARRPSSDPEKDAKAEDIRLKNGTITYAEIYASRGMDYEEQWDQRAKENKILKNKNLDFSENSGNMDSTNNSTNLDKPETKTGTDTKPVGSSSTSDTTKDSESLTDAAKTGDIQQTGLNGAQIASLESIAEKIALGTYSVASGVLLLRISFPLADITLLTQLVTELAKTKPAKVPENVPTNAA